jgi:mannose-1-phosphate guanylyltransferase
MTVDRNRAIADTILVVGNIDNCHLSKQVLEKSKQIISISLSLHQNPALLLLACFASGQIILSCYTIRSYYWRDGLYKASIQNYCKKLTVYRNFESFPTRPGNRLWVYRTQGDDVVSFREKKIKLSRIYS